MTSCPPVAVSDSRRSYRLCTRRDIAPHAGQAAWEHRVLATIRTNRPARKIRSTDTLARCGSKTPALSRWHDEHDHKNHDHGTTGHAGLNRSRKLCQSLKNGPVSSLEF
jgi:hypothetical protein